MTRALRTTVAALAITAGSLALGAGVGSAASTHDHRFYTSSDARCERFVDDANRALSVGNERRAARILEDAVDRGCILILVGS